MLKMMIQVDTNQVITAVSGAAHLGYDDGELLGQPITVIIPAQHHAGHHTGFNRLVTTGVKKILGTWLTLPAINKSGAEQMVNLVLTEEKGPDGSHSIIAYLK